VVAETEDASKVGAYLREVGGDQGAAMRVAMISAGVRRSYKLSATPTTLVVANDGTVEQSWSGLWGGTDVAQASSVLGFSFSSHLSSNQ
jgi:hypothetical protein